MAYTLTFAKRAVAAAGAALLLGGLAGCATPFNANVSRYSAQLPAPQGQTFAVVAADPALALGCCQCRRLGLHYFHFRFRRRQWCGPPRLTVARALNNVQIDRGVQETA